MYHNEVLILTIYDYKTRGGKNVILSYIDKLSDSERLAIYDIRDQLRTNGMDALLKFDTRQLRGKLWEIKVFQTRIMYVVIDIDSIAFLHICKKQKGKAEKMELEKALIRGRNEGIL